MGCDVIKPREGCVVDVFTSFVCGCVERSRLLRYAEQSEQVQGDADMKKACVLFGRYPEMGKGKTRLAAMLGKESTFLLYRALLADTAWKISRISFAQPVAALASGEGHPEAPPDPLGRASFSAFLRIGQAGDSFGARLGGAFERVLALGFEQIVLVGTDSPELEVGDLTCAFQLLEKHDVVLGPAADGGYYLIALKTFHPGLFEGISWSTSAVFEQSVAKARSLGLSVGTTACRGDVDYVEDLIMLRQRRMNPEMSDDHCPATDAWFRGCLAEQNGVVPVLTASGFEVEPA